MNNIQRKHPKYKEMITEQKKKFHPVKFINLSISALGVFEKEYVGTICWNYNTNVGTFEMR